jgi:hypothetical protein
VFSIKREKYEASRVGEDQEHRGLKSHDDACPVRVCDERVEQEAGLLKSAADSIDVEPMAAEHRYGIEYYPHPDGGCSHLRSTARPTGQDDEGAGQFERDIELKRDCGKRYEHQHSQRPRHVLSPDVEQAGSLRILQISRPEYQQAGRRLYINIYTSLSRRCTSLIARRIIR